MPVGKRPMAEDEKFFLRRLSDIYLFVGSDDWRARRDLQLSAGVSGMISMREASLLRSLVGRHFAKQYRTRAPKFAASSVGQFPFVNREQRA